MKRTMRTNAASLPAEPDSCCLPRTVPASKPSIHSIRKCLLSIIWGDCFREWIIEFDSIDPVGRPFGTPTIRRGRSATRSFGWISYSSDTLWILCSGCSRALSSASVRAAGRRRESHRAAKPKAIRNPITRHSPAKTMAGLRILPRTIETPMSRGRS
jgi:hypothetical protein